MKITIISPKREIFNGEGEAVTLPGVAGQMQILEHHADLFSTLKKGKIIVKKGNQSKEFLISSGIAKIFNNEMLILIVENSQQKQN